MKSAVWLVVVLYHPTQQVMKRWRDIESQFPTQLIDNTNDNIGYAAGANRGIEQAIQHGAQWMLLLNQDVECSPGALMELMRRVIGAPPSVIGPYAGALEAKRWTSIFPSEHVDYLSGSILFIHKEIFDKLRGFYEPYFMYYEDVEFCIRAKMHGFPLVHLQVNGIRHTDKQNDPDALELQRYYLARNHLLLVERLAPIPVKLYELGRILKTLNEEKKSSRGGYEGVMDYLVRKFGRKL